VATVLAQVELLDSAGLPGTGVEHAQAVAPDAAAELFNALIMKPGSDVKKTFTCSAAPMEPGTVWHVKCVRTSARLAAMARSQT
jgi:hypothetical protein